MRLALAVFVGSLAPGVALAQSVLTEPEIIVTAPIEGAAIESLQGATVLRRDDIVESLNGGLGDTLDAQPGVATTFFGAGASRPIIRGLGDDRVRVLENGIGAIDASSASPDHAVTADGLDAHRIEILRGAAALAYGGNAIGGVVNVIDESIPTRAPRDGFALDTLVGYSSVNEGLQGSVGLTAGSGPFVFHLSGAGRSTGDYETPLGEAENSFVDYSALSGGGSIIGDWGHFGLALKQTDTSYGLPPEAPGEPGGHIELEQSRIETHGAVRVDLGPFDHIDFGGQTANYEHTEFEGDGAPGTIFTNEGWEARIEAHHDGFGDKLEGAIGVQAVDSDFAAVGDESFIGPTTTQDLGMFAVERLDFGGWGLEAGGRYETRSIDNMPGGVREFEAASGSLGAFVRPMQNWFIGATYARTERAPTAIELFADGPHLATESFERGDATLDVETATSVELSARYNSDRFRFEVNLFQVDFEDYIALLQTNLVWYSDPNLVPDEDIVLDTDPILGTLTPDGTSLPVFQFTAQDATFTGGEISLWSRLFSAGDITFSGDIAYDHVEAEFDNGDRPPRIPPSTLTLGLGAESNHWSARAEWVSVADQDRVYTVETPTEGYELVNARVTFRPSGNEGPLAIMLDGRNLTDELARVHASFLKDDLPLPGRNFRLVVTTSF